jgi:AAA+ superfamily predicted ATPase
MEPRNRKEPAPPSGVDQLVQRLASDSGWTDLALPAPEQEALRDIARRAQRRAGAAEPRTLGASAPARTGVTAVFAGSDSATRARAAGVLANELDRDLYRVDLSRVAGKYIGETEKNLTRLFDAAESAGWVLYFDEADALFGKRTDVNDAHDRYANIEVGSLLERLEAFDGLAILATNRKASLDDAFIRRIRHVVSFPDA